MRGRDLLLWLVALLVLGVVNGLVLQKERLISEGQVVLLELAPVDPRSLIQGDYMRLRYAMSREVERSGERDGYIVIRLDKKDIARYVRIHDPQKPLAKDEWLLPYRRRSFDTYIGPESFFFQEGHAKYYADARYGEFRVTGSGDVLLVGLRGDRLEALSPP